MVFIDYLKTVLAFKKIGFEEKKACSTQAPPFDQILFEEFQEKGLVIIPDFFDVDQCDRIKSEIERLIHDYHDEIWIDINNSDHRIFGAEKLSKDINVFGSHSQLESMCRAYHQTDIMNYATLAAKLVAKENNLGSGQGWHRDSVHKRQMKTIIYLNDVDEQGGPFQFVLYSHLRKNIVKEVRNGNLKYNQNRLSEQEIEKVLEENPSLLQTITGKAGTLIFVDTCGLHRGMPIQNGVRYALTNYYFPAYSLNSKGMQALSDLLVKKK